MNASRSSIQLRRAAERHQTYLDAVELNKRFPDTVCVSETHYEDGRHPVPYRQGYCHDFRLPTEHYHGTYREHLLCEGNDE